MDKAVLYLRLSKEDVDKLGRGDDSESIINQRLLLTDYAISKGFSIVDVYSDDDYSGLYDDRPEFDRLIRDSKLGKFNIVLSKSQSRFTRNMEHMEKYLHHDFPLLGIRFIGVVDGADTDVKENKKARQIYGLTNEWYCEDLSENIRAVFQQKMKAGQYLGGFAPYGYEKAPEDKYKFVVDEEAACVVRRIYELFLEGYSVKSICSILEDDKIPNPCIYKNRRGLNYRNVKADEFSMKYGLWSETTVKRILTNETYLGTLQQGTMRKISYKDKKVVPVPKENWIVVEGHHEPIIEEDIFWKVQRLREKRRICARNQEAGKKVHIFAGKLRCAACGHTMVKSGGVKGNSDDWYLRCQLANKSRKKECSSHNIRFSVVEKAVRDRIQDMVHTMLAGSGIKEQLKAWLIFNGEKSTESCSHELKKLRKDAEDITRTLKMVYMDRAGGNISEDMFLGLRESLEMENARIKMKEGRMSSELARRKEACGGKVMLGELLKEKCDYSRLTHEIVNDFIDYIEIAEKNKDTDQQEIIIHWNF